MHFITSNHRKKTGNNLIAKDPRFIDDRKRLVITQSRLPGNLKYLGSHVLLVLLFRYL